MPVHVFEPTDVIPVKNVPVMIFGPPSSGKTAIGQTADDPLTLDLDLGIHRVFNRKRAVRFDTYADLQDAMRRGIGGNHKTLVVDTLGRLLDLMIPVVKESAAKNRGPGGLSPQGYGVLGAMFADWLRETLALGMDLVFVAHEKESESPGGFTVVKPEMPGKMAWAEVHKRIDCIGYLRYEERTKFLEFNPAELWPCCKNPCQWPAIKVPRLEDRPRFLAELLADLKGKMGGASADAANAAKVIAQWQKWLGTDPNLEAFNAKLPEVGTLTNGLKRQVWEMVSRYAGEVGLTFDKTTKTFFVEEASTPNG